MNRFIIHSLKRMKWREGYTIHLHIQQQKVVCSTSSDHKQWKLHSDRMGDNESHIYIHLVNKFGRKWNMLHWGKKGRFRCHSQSPVGSRAHIISMPTPLLPPPPTTKHTTAIILVAMAFRAARKILIKWRSENDISSEIFIMKSHFLLARDPSAVLIFFSRTFCSLTLLALCSQP